jgi:hypothetical protein
MGLDIDQIITKYRGRGIIIDSNLLLLFIVGTKDPNRIATFKRTKQFEKDDFMLVKRFINCFKTVRTTPNILTEVSNLLNQLPEDLKADVYNVFSDCVKNFLEIYETSANLSKNDYFIKYGLTDASIISDSKNDYLVLTDDFRLSGYLSSLGITSINFNHLRPINWAFSRN